VAGVCQEGQTSGEQSSDYFSAHEREGKQKHNPELGAVLIAKIVMGSMRMRMITMRVITMCMTVTFVR
jgi:hypothetical protein